ncbi:MAG: hypothetical protein ABI591_24575 [Kofleriaceae bacterium]
MPLLLGEMTTKAVERQPQGTCDRIAEANANKSMLVEVTGDHLIDPKISQCIQLAERRTPQELFFVKVVRVERGAKVGDLDHEAVDLDATNLELVTESLAPLHDLSQRPVLDEQLGHDPRPRVSHG